MNRNQIFGPILVQVLLTLVLYILLQVSKKRAIKLGQVDLARRALHDDAWPESVMKINNNIRNQFELPVLFYAVSFALWALDAVGLIALVAAWSFAASRIVHSWIHIVPNYVPVRRSAFTFGWVMVIVLAVLATWDLLNPSNLL